MIPTMTTDRLTPGSFSMAQEAALAVRGYAYQTLGLSPLMSLIAPDNMRSVALAEQLGCTPESDFIYPSGAKVVRYRHPGGMQ